MDQPGTSVVITHHIMQGQEQAYEDWLNEIGPACRQSPGYLDWQIIRPIPGLTFSYTVIVRFDTIAHLRQWMDAPTRRQLIEKAAPILAQKDKYYIRSGLDFLFPSGEQATRPPARWKQYLATWSAIYPLSLLIPALLLPLLRWLHLPPNRYVDALFVSATVVCLMVYLVMPNYTQLIKKWLYR